MERTNEQLLMELANKKDLIEELKRNLDKINFILCEWIQDYSFYESPDPQKALEWTIENIDDKDCKNSAKWYMEYSRIHQLIEVGIDYTRYSMQMLDNESSKDIRNS